MTVLGFYQLAYRIFVFFGVLPQILFFYLLPEKSAGKGTRRVELFGILVSLTLAGLVFVLAPVFMPKFFPSFTGGVRAVQIMGFAIIPATISKIKVSDLYSREKANMVFGSRLIALGIGIIGIVLSFNWSLGLLGLASSLLAIQASLAASLIFLPKLFKRGEAGEMAISVIGMVLVTALLLSFTGGENLKIGTHEKRVEGTGLAMDTNVKIIAVDENTERAKTAIRDAFDEINRVEDLMSVEKKTSEIYALNHGQTDWVNLSPKVLKVLKYSKKYSNLTDGRFDPTVKPLVSLWMEKVKETGNVPEPKELTESIELVEWKNLVIDENKGRARFLKEGMKVTLGGIAKGYAIDQACEVLSEHGIQKALVEIGGDIRTIGNKSWTIAIQHPREDEYLGRIELENKAIATSGDYRRYFFLGQQRIHHLINPKTGRPAENCIGVTVVADNCVAADALSTGVFIAGPEGGKSMLDNLGMKGLIIASTEELVKSDLWDFELD